ncbi:MAG: integron integrase, partial [archaeon]|nr:integron integrase [archaeon]
MNPKQSPKLLDQVRAKLRTKHYSYETEKTYIYRIKEFIVYHKKKHPNQMEEKEVEAHLTWLATVRKVSSSTQNQAFCAILFLYKHILN